MKYQALFSIQIRKIITQDLSFFKADLFLRVTCKLHVDVAPILLSAIFKVSTDMHHALFRIPALHVHHGL